MNIAKRYLDGLMDPIAAVFDGYQKRIYVDGVLDATVVAGHSTLGRAGNSSSVRYGYIGDGSESETFNGAGPGESGQLRNDKWYTGGVDDVRLWHTARSQADIQENKDKRLLGSEANLVLYYDFNEGAGTNVYDKGIWGSWSV